MKQQGLLFSLDGLLSLILVIVLAGVIAQQGLATEEKSGAFEGLNDKAFDRAMVDMYREAPSAEAINASAEFGKCVEVYYLEPDNALNVRATHIVQSFCEEA